MLRLRSDFEGHTSSSTEEYLKIFTEQASKKFIGNVQTDFRVIEFESQKIPITINDVDYENSYVCSPYTQNIEYAKAELSLLNKPLLEPALHGALSLAGHLFRSAHINRCVSVNNWLLSTNPYAQNFPAEVDGLTKFLIREFPKHAIVFRCVYPEWKLFENLKRLGCEMLTTRQVYFFDGQNAEFSNKYVVKRDKKLFKKFGYRRAAHDEIEQSSTKRILELYEKLYIEKHSKLNPQYTEDFIRECLSKKLFEFEALIDHEGKIDGIIGYFENGGTLTTPFLGYETDKPQNLGLYRMLVSLVLEKAEREKLNLNFSSGAGEFKRRRGGEAKIEKTAVYCKHLDWKQRAVWKSLSFVTEKFVEPTYQRLGI